MGADKSLVFWVFLAIALPAFYLTYYYLSVCYISTLLVKSFFLSLAPQATLLVEAEAVFLNRLTKQLYM
jgi:hypothetical protein